MSNHRAGHVIVKRTKPEGQNPKDSWRTVANGLPDSDLTVLIFHRNEDEPVWLGFHDGKVWRRVSGVRCSVTHWREMPEGPAC